MTNVPRIVLASASPRRADVLSMLGLRFDVRPADVPEVLSPDETPEAYVERLSREKALAVSRSQPDALVIAGDTVVVLDRDVLEKPRSATEAVDMLMRLEGDAHTVHTGLAVVAPDGRVVSKVSSPEVTFRSVTRPEASAYVASGEPMDKAGSYGIQGYGSTLVEGIRGDYFAVVGLSPITLHQLLGEIGLAYTFGSISPVDPDA